MILLPRSDRARPTGIVLGLLVATLSLAPAARAETLPFTLGTLAAGPEVSFAVTSDSEVLLHLVRTKPTGSPGSIDLQLTQFTDDSGRPLDVQLIVGSQPNAPKSREHPGLKLTGPVLPVRLAIPQLRTPGKYTGFLILTAGNSDPLVWRIILNPPGRADTLPFTLGSLAAGTEVPFTVTPDGEVTLNLVRTRLTGPPESIDLQLSQFTDDLGRPLDALLIVGKQSNAPRGREHRGLRLTDPLLPVRLAIPQPRTPGKYTGLLVLSASNYDPLVWRIALNPPGGLRPATLEINPRVNTVSVPCFFRCGQAEHPDFLVSLGDKTGLWPLDTITVRQEQATTGFDLQNLTFWFNGVKRDLPGTAAPAKGTAAGPNNPPVPPPWMAARGERPVIGIAVHGLPAGEHSTTLRFQAANSGDDDGQKLALTVRVRHSMLWAGLLLAIAVVVSFVTTKILVMIRQHLAFMSRVRELDKGWLWQMDSVRPVVWARDVLHQTQALSRRYWLTGQARIDTQLMQISTLLGVLEKTHSRQQDFARADAFSSDRVRRRALAALSQTVRDLDGASLSDQQATQIKTQLDNLADWVIVAKEPARYSEALLLAINDLLRIVRLERIPDRGRAVAEAIKKELEQKRQSLPAEVPALEQIDEAYARLKILWERREWPDDEFGSLLTLEQARIEQFFKVADEAVWKRLKSSPPTIRIAELGAGVKVEAYELLRFAIVPPPNVAGTYLFEHNLDYQWTFKQEPLVRRKFFEHMKSFLWKDQQPPTPNDFPGQSSEPSIITYPDRPGCFTASVTVKNPATGETLDPIKLDVPVVESGEFRWYKQFERVELVSFAIAMVIAVVSGLLLYAQKPTFGSLQDYVLLFLWGVGADQGKNLVQLMKS